MNKFRVRKADDYKKNFDFLSDNTNICNAAYHLQFLEHCWTNRKTLESTTRSLMNRTIIVELASIVELVLFELLSNANVELVPRKNKKRLEIESNIGLGRLISKAKYYELIEADMTKRLNKLNEGRNSIHFKQFKEKRILEYDYYTDDMVDQAVETFVEFLKAMFEGSRSRTINLRGRGRRDRSISRPVPKALHRYSRDHGDSVAGSPSGKFPGRGALIATKG